MSKVNQVTNADGNVYLISGNDAVNQSSGAVFDEIFNGIHIDNSLDLVFKEKASKYGISVNFLKAVAQAESAFDANAVSSCGAQGIMQLMPSTSEWLGVDDPFNPVENIDGGARLLASLLESYDGNATLALAAYNAGSGNVEKYGGVPPFEETVNYIYKINDILGGALTDGTGMRVSIEEGVNDNVSGNVNNILNDINNSSENVSSTRISSDVDKAIYSDGKMPIISYEDYMYVMDTYKDILSKLFATILQEHDDNKAIKLYNIDKGNIVYNPVAANINMFNNLSVEVMLKNDAQSLYQAQTSMISPLVAKLLDS